MQEMEYDRKGQAGFELMQSQCISTLHYNIRSSEYLKRNRGRYHIAWDRFECFFLCSDIFFQEQKPNMQSLTLHAHALVGFPSIRINCTIGLPFYVLVAMHILFTRGTGKVAVTTVALCCKASGTYYTVCFFQNTSLYSGWEILTSHNMACDINIIFPSQYVWTKPLRCWCVWVGGNYNINSCCLGLRS